MRISAISDVHVKFPGDPADQLLSRFLQHPLVRESQYVVLLGDIFDLMCGPHPQYIQKFSHLFDQMSELVDKGIHVYYFEGNHDLHLSSLFLYFRPDGKLMPKKAAEIITIDGKTYYFSHGDEHEVDNLRYQNYKKVIQSFPLKFVAEHLMPYSLLSFIGERASKMSRKKGDAIFNEELVRERFRKGIMISTQGKYDFVLGGHSHVQENFVLPDSGSTYVNNGYALRSNTFITIEDHKVTFTKLI